MKKLIAAAFALAASAAQAQLAISLTPAPLADRDWGTPLAMQATVTGPCTGPINGTTVSLWDFDLRVVTTANVTGSSCVGGTLAGAVATFNDMWTHTLEIGSHVLRARIGATNSNVVFARMLPNFQLSWPAGSVQTGISTTPLFSVCSRRQSGQHEREGSPVDVPPPNLRTPYEITSLISGGCTPGTQTGAPPQQQWANILMPIQIPPEAELWVYDNALGGPLQWRKAFRCETPSLCLPPPGTSRLAIVRGASAAFPLFGTDTAVIAAAALAFPQPFSRDFPLQDLWWSGAEQSGWGLNVAKNGQKLFVTLFIYDELGRATWAVMPSGQWDPVHEVWYGNLYIPRGTTYLNYEYAQFDTGPPIGTGSLSFVTPDEGHFDYTINNFSGGKQIFRYVFGPRGQNGDAIPSPYAGIWWGGATQDGWGVSVQQQGDNLFVTWYTYEADRKPTWFFAPAVKKTTATGTTVAFTGQLYRSTGGAWAGQRYSASSTKVTPVGTVDLVFHTEQAGTMTAVVNGTRLVIPIERFPF